MLSLKEVIQKYFSDEKIVKEAKVRLNDSWSGSLSRAKYFYPFPLDFIETEKYYFFDRRGPFGKMNRVSLLLSPLLLGGFALILWLYVWERSSQSFLLVFVAFLIGFLPYFFNKTINEGLINIVVLKKEWVNDTSMDGESKILRGLVSGGDNYSIIYLLETEDQNRLPYFDKLFSGFYLRRFNKLSPELKFQFSYKEEN